MSGPFEPEYAMDRLEARKWMIYRPIMGIILGLIVYLFFTSGLVGFLGIDPKTIHASQAAWVIAFIGGFSEKTHNYN